MKSKMMKRFYILFFFVALAITAAAQPGKFNQNNSRIRHVGLMADSFLAVPKDTFRTAINITAYKNYPWVATSPINRRLYLWDTASYKFRHVGFDSIYVRTSTDSVFGRFYGGEVFLFRKDAGAGVYVDSIYARNDTLYYKKNAVEFYVRKLTDIETIGDVVGAFVNESLTYYYANNRLTIADRDFGDIITSDSGTVWTIGEHAVSYDQIQNVSAINRVLGRKYSLGSVEELTGADVMTMLDVFTSVDNGIVPASGGGSSNFLRADGTWAAPPGGAGTDNTNTGAGFRLVVPSSQAIKSLYNGFAVSIDSTSNISGITFKIDTSLIASQFDISGFQNALSFPYTTGKYLTGYNTFGTLQDSVRSALSAGIDILFSGGAISADTTTGATKLATQGDITRAIAGFSGGTEFGKVDIRTGEDRYVSFRGADKMHFDSVANYWVGFKTSGGKSLSFYDYETTKERFGIDFTKTGLYSPNQATNFRVYNDTAFLELQSTSSKFIVTNIASGVGTKAIRYNPSTGRITYADTTSGGAVTLSSVGGGLDIQTGGAGNIRTLYSSDFDVNTNLISIDYTNGQAASGSNKGFLTSTDWTTFNNKQTAFTSSEETFTGADLTTYDGTTGFVLTVAHTPISSKNRDVFVNTVLVNSYITSISGSIFTIASLPYTISTSDIILIKYNY
jgi:hypothetical protein